MAAKAELRFTSPAVIGQTFAVFSGAAMNFVSQRQGFREVTAGSSASDSAMNFYQAFNADFNYLNEFTVNLTYEQTTVDDGSGNQIPGDIIPIITIEHPDNAKFATLVNSTSFITSTVTTTAQVPETTFSVVLSQATDACGKYKMTVSTNQTTGAIVIEYPIGSATKTTINLDGSASYEVEFSRPSVADTGIVKLKDSVLSDRNVSTVLFNPPPVLSIISVEVEGSPFGAFSTVNATSGLALEYSWNNTTWQGSNTKGGLLAGNFTAYVRDQFGCQKSKDFIVTEDQASGLTVPPLFEIAKHNAMHFVDRSQKNFLGHIAEEITANGKINYCQDWLQEDTVPTQFKSSYPLHTVKLYGCGTTEDITVIQKSDNINRVNIYEGNYTDKEGRLAVYFTTGNIYNADGTPQAEGHILNGTLPLWYEPGVYLQIEGIGVGKITKIIEENNEVFAITNLTGAGAVTNKKITSIHTEHPYEVYEFFIDGATLDGNYIVEIDYGGTDPYWSEVQRFNETLRNYSKIKWWNNEMNDQLLYNTGIKPFRRVKFDKYFTLKGANEREIYQTDTSIKLIKSSSKAVYELDLRPSPMEVARGQMNGLNHANFIDIDGAVFICNSAANVENVGNWYFVKCELALIGQSVESIEADFTQINVQFLKVVDGASGVGFLQV